MFRQSDGKLLGYLSCMVDNDQTACVTTYEYGYNYEWVTYSDASVRLDQETSGGSNRSMTTLGKIEFPVAPNLVAWGLGANWIYLTLGDDQSVTATLDGIVCSLRAEPGDPHDYMEKGVLIPILQLEFVGVGYVNPNKMEEVCLRLVPEGWTP